MRSQHTAGRETTDLAGWHTGACSNAWLHISIIWQHHRIDNKLYFFLNSIKSLTGSCQDHFTASVLYLPLWPRVLNLQFENSRFDDKQSQNIICSRVPMIPGKSWIFISTTSTTWKVLENEFGTERSWKLNFEVLESPEIYLSFKLTAGTE